MKYLIVGLGNIGNEYQDTRHNIGFTILDAFAKASNVFFTENRYGSICEVKLKGRTLILLKPSTFMNLSGNALRYWMQKEKIEIENVLIIVDDIALPFGTLRLKPQGSDAGHNGLKNIQEILGHTNYCRLRFGIGSNYPKGRQIEYVLGKFTPEQAVAIPERAEKCAEIIQSFCLQGMQLTMTQFNGK
jgi:peptidyl-tRNA hydrolase, PTH1 family